MRSTGSTTLPISTGVTMRGPLAGSPAGGDAAGTAGAGCAGASGSTTAGDSSTSGVVSSALTTRSEGRATGAGRFAGTRRGRSRAAAPLGGPGVRGRGCLLPQRLHQVQHPVVPAERGDQIEPLDARADRPPQFPGKTQAHFATVPGSGAEGVPERRGG